MKLLWKLLRQHISIGQFCGFLIANLFGMIIVLAGYQFYNDVLPVFTSGDSFMKPNYIMVSKHIGTATTLSGRSSVFSDNEMKELLSQPFVKKTGAFTSTNYRADASMGVNGQQIMNTELFFESVPDDFIDIKLDDWHYEAGQKEVPIILPRTYINMYNFGFSRSHSLPQISEGLMSMIDFCILIRGNGRQEEFKGKVVAFSSSLSSILVPQDFMDWSNNTFAPEENTQPTRLLMEVTNPADEKISEYFEEHGMDIESDKLDAEKTTYFLRLIVSLVMIIGIIISALSLYILMLSIYLLVQKNTKKLQNLLLIGYTAGKVALPYQLLTASLNILVLAASLIAICVLRGYYMPILQGLYPETGSGTVLYSVIAGFVIFALTTAFNILIIKRKISRL